MCAGVWVCGCQAVTEMSFFGWLVELNCVFVGTEMTRVFVGDDRVFVGRRGRRCRLAGGFVSRHPTALHSSWWRG